MIRTERDTRFAALLCAAISAANGHAPMQFSSEIIARAEAFEKFLLAAAPDTTADKAP